MAFANSLSMSIREGIMSSFKSVYYFGKLRRRREFLKAGGLGQDRYYDWEVWFNKCSNANTLLPFLSNKSKAKPVWLFVIVDEGIIKVGFTTLSLDMADRKYPFLLYFENNIENLNSSNELTNEILAVANKYEGFIKIVTNGDFLDDDKGYFESFDNTHTAVEQLQELSKNIVSDILEMDNYSVMSSYWINLDNFSSINHTGALTCTHHNKIYG